MPNNRPRTIDIAELSAAIDAFKTLGIVNEETPARNTVREQKLIYNNDVVFVAYEELERILEETTDRSVNEVIRKIPNAACVDVWAGAETEVTFVEKDTNTNIDGLYVETETICILPIEAFAEILKEEGLEELIVSNGKPEEYEINSYDGYPEDDTYSPYFILRGFNGTVTVYNFTRHVPDEYVDEYEIITVGTIDGIIKGKEVHYIIKNG